MQHDCNSQQLFRLSARYDLLLPTSELLVRLSKRMIEVLKFNKSDFVEVTGLESKKCIDM